MNKLTSALVALGIISLAGIAQAQTTVYLTGSTAARSIIYGAATTAGQIFTAAPTVLSTNNSSGANTIVYEGNVNHVGTVILNCSFTGSEAGIAAVAGQSLKQSVNGGTYSLPGVPPSFLTPASSYTVAAPLSAIPGAPANPDLTMADTSQAVSQTPQTLYHLVDYGCVGVVPFTIMKGYQSGTTDQAYNDLNNITTAQLNQLIVGPITANFFTGVSADASDYVFMSGRNLGSGTRANFLLNVQQPINNPVDQYAWGASLAALYPTAGVLTFAGSYASGQTLTEVFNDGFDGGSSVQKTLNVDGSGTANGFSAHIILLGYLGISDAANAHATQTSPAGSAIYLPYNGVYESDLGVENGSYTYWGQEHLLGSVSQSPTSNAGYTAAAIVSGIAAQLTSTGAGTKTGAVGPTYSAQSVLIPKSLMQVGRNGHDGGFPVQGGTF